MKQKTNLFQVILCQIKKRTNPFIQFKSIKCNIILNVFEISFNVKIFSDFKRIHKLQCIKLASYRKLIYCSRMSFMAQ